MTTKSKGIQVRYAVFILTMLFVPLSVWGADPGLAFPSTSEMSDQKAGSLLVYNYFTSSACCALQENSRINITNTNSTEGVTVHLFFVDGSTCSVADSWLCLQPLQTSTFSLAEVDPGTSGYVVAIAAEGPTGYHGGGNTGRPISFNYLIGDEFITLASGHLANLGAEAFSVVDGTDPITGAPIPIDPAYVANTPTATILFNGTPGNYNRVPHVVAVSSLPSPSDGLSGSFDTQVILNRIGGSLLGQSDPLGNIFGNLYNDAGVSASLTFNSSSCQLKAGITRTFPRTVPRPNVHIPAGRTGWLRLYPPTLDVGLLGSVLVSDNSPSSTSPYSGGRNLHVLRMSSSVTYMMPVFPPTC
ncbi:MAG: hypothetical protein ACOYLF_12695 [Blastocatellia bacterium]